MSCRFLVDSKAGRRFAVLPLRPQKEEEVPRGALLFSASRWDQRPLLFGRRTPGASPGCFESTLRFLRFCLKNAKASSFYSVHTGVVDVTDVTIS